MNKYLTLLLIIAFINVYATDVKMKFIAHRGASFSYPENSHLSIQMAKELRAHGSEFDLQLTKDHIPFILHDETLERTAAPYQKDFLWSADEYKRLLTTNVNELQWDEIKNIDIGLKKGFPGITLSTYEEILTKLTPDQIYFVEIKGGDFSILPYVQQLAQKYSHMSEQLVYIGFDFDIIKQIKKLIPNSKSYFLINGSELNDPKKLISMLIENNIDGIDVESGFFLKKNVVKMFHDKGLDFVTWVSKIDNLELVKYLHELETDIFTTNLPLDISEKCL